MEGFRDKSRRSIRKKREFYYISSLIDSLEGDDFNENYLIENDAIKLMLQMS